MQCTFFLRAAVVLGVAVVGVPVGAQELTHEAISQAVFKQDWQNNKAFMIKAQVLLDRARFSPGVIDGRWGMNTERAVRAFQERQELEATGELNEETWRRLTSENGEEVVKEYEITSADIKGPFIDRVPKSFREMAKLESLSFTGSQELLAEKFHSDADLLQALNPRYARPGRHPARGFSRLCATYELGCHRARQCDEARHNR